MDPTVFPCRGSASFGDVARGVLLAAAETSSISWNQTQGCHRPLTRWIVRFFSIVFQAGLCKIHTLNHAMKRHSFADFISFPTVDSFVCVRVSALEKSTQKRLAFPFLDPSPNRAKSPRSPLSSQAPLTSQAPLSSQALSGSRALSSQPPLGSEALSSQALSGSRALSSQPPLGSEALSSQALSGSQALSSQAPLTSWTPLAHQGHQASTYSSVDILLDSVTSCEVGRSLFSLSQLRHVAKRITFLVSWQIGVPCQ